MAKKMTRNPFIGEMNIQILRLKNGQDIICNITDIDYESRMFRIECPLDIDVNIIDKKKYILLTPWISLEITDENSCSIRAQDILILIKPRTSLISKYIDLYWSIKSLSNEYDVLDNIKESLIN